MEPMSKASDYRIDRRRVIVATAAVPLALLTGQRMAGAQTSAPTSNCSGMTPESEEGPFFKPGSPERSSLLAASTAGVRLLLTGIVRSSACQPIQGALLEFWHADSKGRYDMVGFDLRGHQHSDDQGRYRLDTIVPGTYPGRTRHIHVKLQRPGGKLVTTELYFPKEPRNGSDGQFTTALVIDVTARTGSRQEGRFDFGLS